MRQKIILITIITLTSLLIVMAIVLGIDYKVKKQQNLTVTYLLQVEDLLMESESKLNFAPEGPNLTLDQLKLLETEGKGWIASAQSLQPPKSFEDHKEVVKKIILKRYAIISSALLMTEIRNYDTNVLEELLNEIHTLKQLENESLLSALEESDVKYEIYEDGTIRYYYRK